MNQQEYQRRLLERETRYPGWKPLLADRPVHIHVDPGYATTYAGQVAAIIRRQPVRPDECIGFNRSRIPCQFSRPCPGRVRS